MGLSECHLLLSLYVDWALLDLTEQTCPIIAAWMDKQIWVSCTFIWYVYAEAQHVIVTCRWGQGRCSGQHNFHRHAPTRRCLSCLFICARQLWPGLWCSLYSHGHQTSTGELVLTLSTAALCHNRWIAWASQHWDVQGMAEERASHCTAFADCSLTCCVRTPEQLDARQSVVLRCS